MNLTKEQMKKIYYQMFSSRTFEECVNGMFMKGMIHGTAHLAIGEEATAAGGVNALRPDDYITVSYTHLRAHETGRNLVCRLLLEKKKKESKK